MKRLDDGGGRWFAQAPSSLLKVGELMSDKDIKKIFALLYEIKKRLAKLEKNIIEKSKEITIDQDEKNTSDFTRGSTLW